MRMLLSLIGLLVSLLLIASSPKFPGFAAIFARAECQCLTENSASPDLFRPKLVNSEELIFTKYLRTAVTRLHNNGGGEIIRCDAFNFPTGLSVKISSDASTCEIAGIPSKTQVLIQGFVVASNHKGRSLAIVPISVNALVLRE